MSIREVDKVRSNSQTSKPCLYIGCVKGGRLLGRLGTMELTYCGKHRKYGERVLNFLINSMLRYKLSNLLRESKQKIFINNEPHFCDECNKKVIAFAKDMVDKVSELEKDQERFGDTGFDYDGPEREPSDED